MFCLLRAAAAIVSVLCVALATPAGAAPLPDWAIGPFVRPRDVNPLIRPLPEARFFCPMRQEDVAWESTASFNPAATILNGRTMLLYRAEDNSGPKVIGRHTSRLGLAISDDGLHFSRNPQPVFFPDRDDQQALEWTGGCEDPRLIDAGDGRFVMTYSQWNGKKDHLAIATTRDFLHWQKFGPAFGRARHGRYLDLDCKSGAIVGQLQGERLVAAQINGSYWMYWGAGAVHLARSPDLINWTPVEDSAGKLLVVLKARPGRFDSGITEAGPPAVLTPRGIVVIYNGQNSQTAGDPELAPATYSVGQALFAADDPSKILARLEHPFFRPQTPWEQTGQYTAGTTFCEGLVRMNGRWLLYYGCADSFVGVAESR